MINVACNNSIALQIKDETPLNAQQLTQDLKNEVDLFALISRISRADY